MDQSIMQLEVINQQIKELTGLYRSAVGASGISENEFWIWYALIALEGDYSQQDICAAWSLTKQTVNSIITNMVRRGHVTLQVVPGTRNRKQICLTSAGRQYGESLVLPISQAEQRAWQRLPAQDQLACTAVMAKYIRILKEEFNGTEKARQI